MLIPINKNQISKLIPSVGTGSQFKYTLGNPRKILQRVIISSVGGFLSLIISTTGDQTNNFWLLLCVVFFLYIIWGPILESSRKNLQLRKYKFFSLFDGYVSDIYKTEMIEEYPKKFNQNLVKESETLKGVRGGIRDSGVNIHSVRLPGLLAHQLVIMGSPGETYTIKHDTIDRKAYMPGVLQLSLIHI